MKDLCTQTAVFCTLLLVVFLSPVLGQEADDNVVRYTPAQEMQQSDNILELEVSKGKRSAHLQWTLDPLEDDAVYEIWRKSDREKSFQPIATGLTEPCYLDTTVSGRNTYRYSIKWQVADSKFGRSNTAEFRIPSRSFAKLLVPGVYQLQTGRNPKGAIYLTGSALSLLVAGGLSGAFIFYKSEAEMSEETYQQCFSSQSGKPVGEAYNDWRDTYKKEKAYRTGAFIAAGVFGLSYVIHWVDFAVFPLQKGCNDGVAQKREATKKSLRVLHPRIACGPQSATICFEF